jgi:predicted membrane protein
VANQLNGFAELGVFSILAAILALAFVVQCLAHLTFAPLPIPLAVLYIIFQAPLQLPEIKIWTLILAAILASCGFAFLLPKKRRHEKIFSAFNPGNSKNNPGKVYVETGDNDNNPSVSVNFGAVSRRLQADSLETAQLYCNFGALEVYFDQAKLSPRGAEVNLNCSFGAIKLLIPQNWCVVDRINCTLGGVDMAKSPITPPENAPRLVLTGSVSLGGVEVRYV